MATNPTQQASGGRDDPVVTSLVTRASNGDRQAWDALVERYAPLIWSICRSHRLEGADAMSGPGADGPFEVAVEPQNDQYDPDDDRWRDQVATLYTDLHAQVDTVRRGHPVEGAKGAIDQLIIALGSAGAFSAAVDCLRAWLGRDRDRRIDVRWDENGVQRSVTLTGEAVDVETIREIAKAAVDRVGGPSWPAGTEPS